MAFGGPPIFDMPHDDWLSDIDDKPVKKSKNGNDKGNKKSLANKVAYEGCILQKATPRVGDVESWARVGKYALPGSDIELAELSKKYRQELGDPMTAFGRLSADQQGVVTRYIAQRQAEETDKNVDWTLDCVVRHRGPVKVKGAWTRPRTETKHIKVIIRRQDRNAPRGAITSLTGRSNTFASGDIIDLSDPLPKKKKEGGKKKKDHDPFGDFIEPPYNGPPIGGHPDPFAGLGQDPHPLNVPPPPPPAPHFQHHHQPPPPPGAIPVDQFDRHQHHGPPHPFEPYPQFNTADLHDPRYQHQVHPQFQTRRQTPVQDDRRSRSWSRERRREQSRERRRELSRERRLIREEEELRARKEALRREQEEQAEEDRRQQQANQYRMFSKLDEMQGTFEERMQELNGKVEDMKIRQRSRRGSSNGSYRDDIWSLPSGGSFTPPSSPGLSDISPINFGGGRNKLYRDSRGYPIERRNSSRYRSAAIVEPYNTEQERRRRSGSSSYPNVMARVVQAPMPPPTIRRHRSRQRATPQIQYDDYPTGEKIRALPQYEGQEYPRADFRGRRRQQQQQQQQQEQDERVYVYESNNNDRRGYSRR